MTIRRRRAGGTEGHAFWRPVDRPASVVACKVEILRRAGRLDAFPKKLLPALATVGLHVGPHNRCAHETPAPLGWRRCAADPGCPMLIPARAEDDLCRLHRDDIHAVIHVANTEYRELMGAS